MWSLLPANWRLTLIVATTLFAAWAWDGLHVAFTGQHASPLDLISPVVFGLGTVATLAFTATWRMLWNAVPALGRRVFPDLNGRWEGKLLSNWIDPQTGKDIAPIEATVWIRQGLFKTTVRLKTGESTSRSTRAILEPFRDIGCFKVWYTYNSDPDAQVRHRSSPHEGMASLEYDITAPGKAKIRYFTDRGTTGDIELTRTSRDPDA
ncbi:Cap15 family cyclic dinucleotide receptor domain-containing protein [Phenylobacterium soli]|uniref:CD-NTase-associated protein 15 domain-containing protein n=1 Tax=Phenylobacterium soli TaxID=2170551 RepID=A0A328AKV8_9CAUL|nr:hypothetical protein [Phenylobacterium soli]RAK55573.1 hypothetical protein DJ017_14175 [Phenylobacterium soli]